MTKIVVAIAAALLLVAAAPADAQKKKSKPPIPFTEEFLQNPDNIAGGKKVWDKQCRACHGKQAYPGKAPKLKPAKYKPDFVYRRVTDGFRKMPSWKRVFSDEQRMQVTAYILSDRFAP